MKKIKEKDYRYKDFDLPKGAHSFLRKKIIEHESPTIAISLTCDQRIITVHENNHIYLWSICYDEIRQIILPPLSQNDEEILAISGGTWQGAIITNHNKLYFIHLEQGGITKQLQFKESFDKDSQILFSPDGKKCALTFPNFGCTIIDANTTETIYQFKDKKISKIVWMDSNSLAYTSAKKVQELCLKKKEVINQFTCKTNITSLSFNDKPYFILCGLANGELLTIGTKKWSKQKKYKISDSAILASMIVNQDQYMNIVDSEQNLYGWDRNNSYCIWKAKISDDTELKTCSSVPNTIAGIDKHNYPWFCGFIEMFKRTHPWHSFNHLINFQQQQKLLSVDTFGNMYWHTSQGQFEPAGHSPTNQIRKAKDFNFDLAKLFSVTIQSPFNLPKVSREVPEEMISSLFGVDEAGIAQAKMEGNRVCYFDEEAQEIWKCQIDFEPQDAKIFMYKKSIVVLGKNHWGLIDIHSGELNKVYEFKEMFESLIAGQQKEYISLESEDHTLVICELNNGKILVKKRYGLKIRVLDRPDHDEVWVLGQHGLDIIHPASNKIVNHPWFIHSLHADFSHDASELWVNYSYCTLYFDTKSLDCLGCLFHKPNLNNKIQLIHQNQFNLSYSGQDSPHGKIDYPITFNKKELFTPPSLFSKLMKHGQEELHSLWGYSDKEEFQEFATQKNIDELSDNMKCEWYMTVLFEYFKSCCQASFKIQSQLATKFKQLFASFKAWEKQLNVEHLSPKAYDLLIVLHYLLEYNTPGIKPLLNKYKKKHPDRSSSYEIYLPESKTSDSKLLKEKKVKEKAVSESLNSRFEKVEKLIHFKSKMDNHIDDFVLKNNLSNYSFNGEIESFSHNGIHQDLYFGPIETNQHDWINYFAIHFPAVLFDQYHIFRKDKHTFAIDSQERHILLSTSLPKETSELNNINIDEIRGEHEHCEYFYLWIRSKEQIPLLKTINKNIKLGLTLHRDIQLSELPKLDNLILIDSHVPDTNYLEPLVKKFPNLKVLILHESKGFNYNLLEGLNLDGLDLSSRNEFEDIRFINKIGPLKWLNLNLAHGELPTGLHDLIECNLSMITPYQMGPNEFKELCKYKNINSLELNGKVKNKDLGILENLNKVKNLSLNLGLRKYEIPLLESVKSLALGLGKNPDFIEDLAKCLPNLIQFKTGGSTFQNGDVLSSFKKLSCLNLDNVPKLENLNFLKQLDQLQCLFFHFHTSWEQIDATPIKEMKSLKYLSLASNNYLNHLESLADHPTLKYIVTEEGIELKIPKGRKLKRGLHLGRTDD